MPIIVCRPRKTNFRFVFPFAANKWKFAVSIFCLQKTKETAVSCSCMYPAELGDR
jgi:hypothetical protein